MDKRYAICILLDSQQILYPIISSSTFFCLKLKNLITTEPIEFFSSGKLHIVPGTILGFLIFSIVKVLDYSVNLRLLSP